MKVTHIMKIISTPHTSTCDVAFMQKIESKYKANMATVQKVLSVA